MATIRKLNDKWRAEIARKGQRLSKVFSTRAEAKDWAARREYLLLNGDKVAAAMKLRELLERYAREVSPTKRGARWEEFRLMAMARDPIGEIALKDLTAKEIAEWRDRRATEVAPSSVRREMNLLGSVFTKARKEWGLIPASPMSDVKRPPDPPGRSRRPSSDEIERMRHVAGTDLGNRTARAFHAFLFAIETAMRAGEIVGLSRDRVDLTKQVAHLPMTKNGTPRDVPLSSEAIRLFEALPELEPAFGLSSMQLASLFRKITQKAAIEDLTFHDSRHEAITRLSKKLEVLELARMVGHRDLKMLLTYYNETAEDLARKLG